MLEIEPHIILWQGDITTLKCDCIVNAGNEEGLGCFNPQHLCVDCNTYIRWYAFTS